MLRRGVRESSMSYRRTVSRSHRAAAGLGAGEGIGELLVLYMGVLVLGGIGVAAVAGTVARRATGSKKTGDRVALGVAVGEVVLAGAYYEYHQYRNQQQSQAMIASMASHQQAVAAALAAGAPATARTDAACQHGIAAGTAGTGCYTCPTGQRAAYRPTDRQIVCVPNSAPVI